ncbi:coproporphyrinogen III oxidase family protein [bacterium]|nr:coproporphyrinogen III oxidase family protein [bacterium]
MHAQAIALDAPPTCGTLFPVNLYIHIPFCKSKCGYCDFLSWPVSDIWHADQVIAGYFAAIKREIEQYYEMMRRRTVENFKSKARGRKRERKSKMKSRAREVCPDLLKTVFIGGGTPTVPDPEHLIGLVRHIGGLWGFAPDYEFTVEANPDTLADYPLAELQDVGVNRLSIGVQSLHSHHLARLGRIADPGRVKAGLERVEREWRGRLSFDILYGVQAQRIEDIYCDIERLMEYAPGHISAYRLTPEPGTPLSRIIELGKTVLPGALESLRQQDFIERALDRHGFSRYEISNYAKPDEECRHNVAVWGGKDYIGTGVGASGFTGGTRYSNVEAPETYFARIKVGKLPRESEESLDVIGRERERIAFGLRMTRGIGISQELADAVAAEYLVAGGDGEKVDGFTELYGDIRALIADGLLVCEQDKLRIAPGKMHFHDFIAAKLI